MSRCSGPECHGGNGIACHAEEKGAIVAARGIIYVSAQPGAQGAANAHARKQKIGYGAVLLAVEQVSRSGKYCG